MQVLIGCEESGYIRSEFRRHGHDAYSCDLMPAADGGPHIRSDIVTLLQGAKGNEWDLIIMHPPCTFMSVSGNRWYAGTDKRETAMQWTQELWQLALKASPRVCFEQPVSVLSLPGARKQTVQPWMFGVMESKATVLHSAGLSTLKPWVTARPAVVRESVWKMAPSDDRSRKRGHLPWLARPMAEQWG